MRDRLPGLAAEIAFWVLLSLPSLLLTAIAAAGVVLEGADWQDQFIERAVEITSVALTQDTVDTLIVPILERLITEGGLTLVSTAAVVTLWTASRAVRVVLTALAIVYGAEDRRAGWQDRLLGLGITVAGLIVGLIIAPLLVFGPEFGETLQGWVDVDLDPLPAIWSALYWPTTVVLAMLTLSLLYYLGVPGRRSWLRALPGAVLATAVWLAGSGGLRVYGQWIAAGESAYGPLAGPVVALLWIWLSGFAVLLGGELNAQIDVVWPRRERRADDDDLLTDKPDELTTDMPDAASDETTRPINAPEQRRS